MAVQFRRDEMPAAPVSTAEVRDDDSVDNDFARGMLIAVRSSVMWLVPAAVLLAIAVRGMKKELIAADHLFFEGGGDHWQESLMPAVLFIFFGAVFGALLAWHIGARTSLGNLLICLATGLVALLLAVVGAIYAALVFENGMPLFVWLSLALMMAASMAGAWGLTRWTG